MVERLAWLIPLAPWLAGAWIALGYLMGRNRGEAGERTTARTALGGMGLSLALLLALDLHSLIQGAPGQVTLGPWLQSGSFQVMISFALDPLGLAVGSLVAVITLLTARFAVNYMHREGGFQRFFAVLCLFSGAMLLIVTAGNAVLAFVGWEAAGVASYLLIAYAFDRPVATGNATRVLVTNRFGDAGFVMGIALAFTLLGGIEWTAMAAGARQAGALATGLVAGGFVLAALAKSAQFPFVAWIGRALEGPTPSSAVFYGSLMIHAGVFLLLRLEPLLVHSPAAGVVLVVAGTLTALYGTLGGLVQSDVKSVLIFSTQAQVGVMLVECGLGWYTLAAWHLGLHATWRLYQFLSAPGYMHHNLLSGPPRPVPARLAGNRLLHAAALQRFWVDELTNALLVRPTAALARDLQSFDDLVVNRLVGRHGEEEWTGVLGQVDGAGPEPAAGVVYGRGLPGRLLERTADGLHWFEERMVLSSGGEGLLRGLRLLGGYVVLMDRLLGQPRYLLLLIALTFVVIL